MQFLFRPSAARRALCLLTLLTVSLVSGCGGGGLTDLFDDADAPIVLTPACGTPAPLEGTFDADTPRYIVYFVAGTNVTEKTARMAAQYGFIPEEVYQRAVGFAARLTPEAVAALRCDPAVARIVYDGGAAGGGA